MRILTLLTLFFLSITVTQAQVVLVNSPTDLARGYTFGDTGENWGASLLDSIWTGDAVLIEDDADPTSDGCTAAVMGSDYTGKVVLIDRGACEFGLKSLNAETAGAMAVIIMNNNPGEGAIDLGAGAVGGQVTIPVVCLSFEDGLLLKETLADGTTINISIGAIQFANDLQITDLGTLKSFTGTIPASQVEPGNYSFTPAVSITNTGFNPASNLSADVKIDFTPVGAGTGVNVYTSAATLAALASDSVVILQAPDAFDVTDADLGRYELSYDITSDSTDLLPIDNSISQTFDVVEGAMARGSWDFDNNRPFVSFNTTINGGGNIEFFQGVKFPVAGDDGYQIDSIYFSLGTDQPDLQGTDVLASIYVWTDGGEIGTVEEGEFENVAFGNYSSSSTVDEEWVSMDIVDAATGGRFIFDPALTYFLGLKYIGANTVTFGFDNTYNNFLAFSVAESDDQLPYMLSNTFDDNNVSSLDDLSFFTDFGATLAVGYYISPAIIDGVDNPTLDANISIYPNPASEILYADIKLGEIADQLNYSILDISGKTVYSMDAKNVDNYVAELNVSNLAAGTYYLRLLDGDKILTKSFIVAK